MGCRFMMNKKYLQVRVCIPVLLTVYLLALAILQCVFIHSQLETNHALCAFQFQQIQEDIKFVKKVGDLQQTKDI